MTLNTWHEWEGRIVGGRFPLGPYLGGSKCSAVYLTDFGGRRAVVKLIGADTPDAQAQLSRWEAALNVAHPNLLRVYDTGLWHADEEQDMFFAVMEYADENLGEILKERRLTPSETREMLAPTLAALESLHQQHLVHGDLKPANVLAVGPELKLASDGVRRFGTRLTGREQEDQRAAPEVFASGVSAKNDIWAVGLLVLEAMTGNTAFEDKIKENPTVLIGTLPQPFADIARECLHDDPAKRCSIIEIRQMLSRPVEVKKPEPPVATVQDESPKSAKLPDSKPAAPVAAEKKSEGVKSIVLLSEPNAPATQPTAKATAKSPATQVEPERDATPIDLKLLLDEEPVSSRKNRFLPLAIAILVGIIALVMLVRFLGHSGAPKAEPIAAQPTAEPVSNPAPTAAVSQQAARPSSGAVAHQVMPEVSRVAQNSIHGVVKVRVQLNVNESGQVALAGLAAQGPSRYFAKQALDAARQWTFTPPAVDGKPVASRWMLEFDFRRSGVKAKSRMT